MKYADQIIKWGRVKPFFDKTYNFNTIDIETIDNKLFMLGYTLHKQHHVKYDNFYNHFHDLIIQSVQSKKDILTWSRYDNTFLLKLILSKANKSDIRGILLKVGKVTPIYNYQYDNFTITIVNIIKTCELNADQCNILCANSSSISYITGCLVSIILSKSTIKSIVSLPIKPT